MSELSDTSVLAIDVGSSVIKLGWFPPTGDCATQKVGGPLGIVAPALPTPERTANVYHAWHPVDRWISVLSQYLEEEFPAFDGAHAVICSVHPQAKDHAIEVLGHRNLAGLHVIDRSTLPVVVRVNEPDRVGVDRLVGALAVNHLRSPESPAIFVSMGTATTVNLVGADGGFEGGAILAGPALQLAALHDATASLPNLGSANLEAPAVVGRSTEEALASGAYWGGVGAINEIVHRIADGLNAAPELFITGGAAGAFAPQIALGGRPAKLVPHLVLAGIRLAAERLIAP